MKAVANKKKPDLCSYSGWVTVFPLRSPKFCRILKYSIFFVERIRDFSSFHTFLVCWIFLYREAIVSEQTSVTGGKPFLFRGSLISLHLKVWCYVPNSLMCECFSVWKLREMSHCSTELRKSQELKHDNKKKKGIQPFFLALSYCSP